MTLILADTTVLSNFAQVGRPDLLRQAFPGVGAPRTVREELAAGERLGRVPVVDWSWLGFVALREAEILRASELQRVVQAGEAACLAVVEARGGLVLTDDSAARRLAGTLGLRISGTLGALARLVAREILPLTPGENLLAEMIARGYRSPVLAGQHSCLSTKRLGIANPAAPVTTRLLLRHLMKTTNALLYRSDLLSSHTMQPSTPRRQTGKSEELPRFNLFARFCRPGAPGEGAFSAIDARCIASAVMEPRSGEPNARPSVRINGAESRRSLALRSLPSSGRQ